MTAAAGSGTETMGDFLLSGGLQMRKLVARRSLRVTRLAQTVAGILFAYLFANASDIRKALAQEDSNATKTRKSVGHGKQRIDRLQRGRAIVAIGLRSDRLRP